MKEINLKRNRKRWSFLRPSLVCTVQLLLLVYAGRSSGKPASRKWTKDIVGEDLTTYDNYHDLKQALLAGHTLSFSVRPGLCKVATRPASIVGTPIGFTTRHWWIEELATREEILHLRNLYLQNDGSSVGASWVQQELLIRSDLDVGEYTSQIISFLYPFRYDTGNESKAEHVPKDPLVEHFGSCQLGDAVIALDLTGSSSEEMVSLADFDSLKRELLSGRQVEGWVDLDACANPEGTSQKAGVGVPRQHGFTVESYRVNAPGRASETIVLVSAWTDEVDPAPTPPPPSPVGSPRATIWNHIELQTSSTALLEGKQRFDVRIITSSSESFGVSEASKTVTIQCDVPSGGVRLFTRRFDEEQRYTVFEDLRDDLAMGHKFHGQTYDGYCTNKWGHIVGDQITGRILRTWETKAPTEAGGIHEPLITFYHADGIGAGESGTAASLQVTEMTITQTSPVDHNAPIVTSRYLATVPGSLETSINSESDCYLGSSAFMHSPRDDGAVMRKKEDLTAVRDLGAVPSFGAVFTRTSFGAAAEESANKAILFERRRTSFDTGAFLAGKLNSLPGSFRASSRPALVATGDNGNQIAWLFYTIELDLETGLSTLTRTIVDVGNVKATPDEWDTCGFQTSAPQGQGRGVSPCSFILLLNR